MSDNIWADLAAPLPSHAIEWRQDGKPTARDGKFFARFVPYVTTQYVRERLDQVVPGEWDSELTREPNADHLDEKSGESTANYVYHCALSVMGRTREDVGEGDAPKTAATDAFKRAAMRFGIAHELYSFGPNWVQVDSDSKFAKAVEDPQAAYERKQGAQPRSASSGDNAGKAAVAPTQGLSEQDKADARAAVGLDKPAQIVKPAPAGDALACPKCSGRMWDNRVDKKNPRSPDWKCRDKACDGVFWKDADGRKEAEPVVAAAPANSKPWEDTSDEIPF